MAARSTPPAVASMAGVDALCLSVAVDGLLVEVAPLEALLRRQIAAEGLRIAPPQEVGPTLRITFRGSWRTTTGRLVDIRVALEQPAVLCRELESCPWTAQPYPVITWQEGLVGTVHPAAVGEGVAALATDAAQSFLLEWRQAQVSPPSLVPAVLCMGMPPERLN